MKNLKLVAGFILIMFPVIYKEVILNVPSEVSMLLLKCIIYFGLWCICKTGAKLFIKSWNSKEGE